MKNVTFVLFDRTRFRGKSSGYGAPVTGEVIFSTAMVDYPKGLADPSYEGQLLAFTFLLVSNYGVLPFTVEENDIPPFMESERIHVSALIVSGYSDYYSHWDAVENLPEWLKREKVAGTTGINTRELTGVLRESDVMMGKTLSGKNPELIPEADCVDINFVDRVNCKEIIRYDEGAGKKVVLVNCGVKVNIIRSLSSHGVEVVRIPWNYDYTDMKSDGLFLANGSSDLGIYEKAVNIIRKQVSESRKPICSICIGNQLLARAGGTTIYKLKYDHRLYNQLVRRVGTNKYYVTSQSHGYAVNARTLETDWEELFVNMNGGSNEDIRHKTNLWFSSQFHPKACSGSVDISFTFDELIETLR